MIIILLPSNLEMYLHQELCNTRLTDVKVRSGSEERDEEGQKVKVRPKAKVCLPGPYLRACTLNVERPHQCIKIEVLGGSDVEFEGRVGQSGG